MKTAAALGLVAAAVGLAACGQGDPPLRLRHVAKRQLTYELEQHEQAEHPLIGLGGSLDVAERISLSCLSVEPDGSGHYEVTVKHVKVAAPPASGAAVDTTLGRPVEGDKIGANAVTQALLPRTALVVVGPVGGVVGAQPDLEVGKHLSEWMKAKPVASRKVIFRLAEALDAGPVVHRWFTPLAALFPPNEHTPPGTSWVASPPVVETPAGRLLPKIDVTFTKDGDIGTLEGKGTLTLDGEPPANRLLDLEGASLTMTAKIDLARGVLVSYDEAGRFDFRLRGEGKLPAPWAHTRKLRLVDVTDAPEAARK